MTPTNDRVSAGKLAHTGLAFFSRMSASATHEIKNSLAIINESAGLMQDLAVMAQSGRALSPERVADISHRIEKHVKQADGAARKLNHFSHGMDHSRQTVDLEQTILFLLDMGARLIEMQGADIQVLPPSSPALVDTSLFFLETLIWRCIDAACLGPDASKQLTISFQRDTGPGIWFAVDSLTRGPIDALIDSETTQMLLIQLGMSIEKQIENKRFGLVWPDSG